MTIAARHFVLATAGHVDHGKSSLVMALTGVDPDRLPEEKRRGMTIDLGFAHLTLPLPDGPALQIGVVDVPGHEDFVKNMVAGVGAVDAALLVISADDGPMPQTAEHLQILTYVGITRGVVALSKADLLHDLPMAVDRIRAFLRGSTLESAPIVPVSAKTGSGIDALRTALIGVLSTAPPAADHGKPRLAIDRAFQVRGTGTVVTGTLTGGSFARGQVVAIQPSGIASRIRGIQLHGVDTEFATSGSRVALNLADVIPAQGLRAAGTVGRGCWVTAIHTAPPALILDAVLTTALQPDSQKDERLRDNLTVKVHLGTAAVVARIQWDSTARRYARLRLTEPIAALIGDRFVLRSVSDQHTLAGGIILDAFANVRRRVSFRRDSVQHQLLETRSTSPFDADALIESALERDRILVRDDCFAVLPFDTTTLTNRCAVLTQRQKLFASGPVLIRADDLKHVVGTVRRAIDAYHVAHPQQQGMPLTEVRRIVLQTFNFARQSPVTEPLCDAIIPVLTGSHFMRTGTVLRRTDHRPELPPKLAAAGGAILGALRDRPFDPPSTKELCRTDASLQALKYLIVTGQVVDLGQNNVLLADAYAEAIDRIRHQLRITGSATVSELKASLGSSRRIMVPLLERLDREHVTRRQGDQRLLA